MKSIVGVFDSFDTAQSAAVALQNSGIDPRRITVLAPGSPQSAWDRVPTAGTEQPGLGAAMGGLVGGAVGAAAGAPLGAALASLLIPGVGPVVAVGIAGAAILGAGGVAAGAAAGRSIEGRLFTGLPDDEVFFYEDALRRGRAVVIAFAADDQQKAVAREVLEHGGAESLDAARESWWLGMRSAEQEHYHSHEEDSFRRGFEAALRPAMRGKTYDEALPDLREHWADASDAAFRRGFERGQAHLLELMGSPM